MRKLCRKPDVLLKWSVMCLCMSLTSFTQPATLHEVKIKGQKMVMAIKKKKLRFTGHYSNLRNV